MSLGGINIGYHLSPWQLQVDASPAIMKLVRGGRRLGKSKYAIKYICDSARIPGSKNWIVAPTARQGRDIFWHELSFILEKSGVIKRKNAATCDFTLINDAQIGIRGTNIEDNLRGNGLDSIVLDEYAYHKPHVWEQILRPQVIDRKGRALFISSPKGFNHFKKMEDYIRAQSLNSKDYAAFHFSIYDNPHLDKSFIDQERSSVSDDAWRQEYLAEYVEWVGLVYHEFGSDNTYCPTDHYKNYMDTPYVKALDWGMQDDTAAAWLNIIDNKIIFTEEYAQGNMDISRQCAEIMRRDRGRFCVNQHTVLDKTAFKRESDGKSVAQTFMELGIRPIHKSTGTIEGGQDIVKRLLRSKQLMVSTRCQKAIRAMKEWEYGQHEPDILAAMRYGCNYCVERKLITVDNLDIPKVKEEIIEVPHNPMIIPRVRIHKDIGWNFEDGCAE